MRDILVMSEINTFFFFFLFDGDLYFIQQKRKKEKIYTLLHSVPNKIL